MAASVHRRAGASIARVLASPVDPDPKLDEIRVFSKKILGVVHLFAVASDGTVYQITPPAAAGGGQIGATFFGLTAGTGNGGATDYAATIAVNTAIPFPRLGPASAAAGIVLAGFNQFELPVTGLYEVSWAISFLEASQLLLKLGAAELPHTTTTSGAGTQQNCNTVIIEAVAGDLLSLCNASGNAAALTVQTADGALTHAQAPTLTIDRIAT